MPAFNSQSNLTAAQKTPVAVGGTTVGTRRAVNVVAGSNVTVTAQDDSANDRVNVTINAPTAGAGSVAIQDDGVAKGSVPTINFRNGLSAAVSGSVVNVDASGVGGANADKTAPELGINTSTGPFDHQNAAIQSALDDYLNLTLPGGRASGTQYSDSVQARIYSFNGPIAVPAYNGRLGGQSLITGGHYRAADGAYYVVNGSDIEGAAIYFKTNNELSTDNRYVPAGAPCEGVIENMVLTCESGANGTGRSKLTGFWYNIYEDATHLDTSSRTRYPGFWQTHGRFRASNNHATGFFIGHRVLNNNYGHMKRLVSTVCDIGFMFAADGYAAQEGNVDARVCEEFSAWSCNIGFLHVAHPSSFAGDNTIEWFMIKQSQHRGTGISMATANGAEVGNQVWTFKGLGTEYGQVMDGSSRVLTLEYQDTAVKPTTYTVTVRSAEIHCALGNYMILADGSHSATDKARVCIFLDGNEAVVDCHEFAAPMQTLFTSYANHNNALIKPGPYFPGGGTCMNMLGWPTRGAFLENNLYTFSHTYWHFAGTAYAAPMNYNGSAATSLHSSWNPLRPSFSNSIGGVTQATAVDPNTGELCTKVTFPSTTQYAGTTKTATTALRTGGLGSPGAGRSMAITPYLRGGSSAASDYSGGSYHAIMFEVYNDEAFDIHVQPFICLADGTSATGYWTNDAVDTESAGYWNAGQRVYEHITFWAGKRMTFVFIYSAMQADRCFALMPFYPLDTQMSLHITKFAYFTTPDKATFNRYVLNREWRMP